MSCGGFTVPPGYGFHPTDEKLLSDLEEKNRCKDSEITTIIPEIDVCKHEPHELPANILSGRRLGRKFAESLKSHVNCISSLFVYSALLWYCCGCV
ncbi:putative transcription factor NAM family [Rosa chinensis]|uniref:Putative transcription factor NAM family n=1 Tax=Rosa chinensis TaxID=74649 RepID=A0A2P6SC63_ROSCH|nr:putative transcription factor NAM family [Rosa chinensis]